MSYTFTTLFAPDFEELARDLLGRELGMRFEAFGPGPDGGVDGRHASAEGSLVLQAKHFAGSRYSTLAARMRKERASIDRLSPERYLLATSQTMSPENKADLAGIIGPALLSESDVFTAGDLNGLLRKFSDIEKAHIKLWLSSAAVLEAVIHSAAINFTNLSRQDIEAKVQVYAHNPSFQASYDKLEAHHVLIISGPPGVGKTTLAEMLAFAYMSEGWELHAIRSLDDGFASIVDTKKQIFFFDDFLGTIALDAKALSTKDSELARFLRRIRKTKNARFILTTRAYILEEARRVSEHLADQRLDVTKYVLDVGTYTRRIRARILYNHLKVAELSEDHVRALIAACAIPKIVDHENYNPRVVEWMTDVLRVGDINPEDYAEAFLDALANPRQLWDTAFRTHIPHKCRHLLFALFFCSEYGVKIRELRIVFEPLHRHLCTSYGIAHDPKDFDESLKILEGGFIKISGSSVSFVNPSFRDYISEYLSDLGMLCGFSTVAVKADWARAVWRHGTKCKLDPADTKEFANGFRSIAELFPQLTYWRRTGRGYEVDACDLDNSDRIKLLLDWFVASRNDEFAHIALVLVHKPVNGFSAWSDGRALVELARQIRDGSYFDDLPNAAELIEALEQAVINLLEGVGADDLERISDAIEAAPSLGDEVAQAVEIAIRKEFAEVDAITAEIDSESTLSDHRDALKKLAVRANISGPILQAAILIVEKRIEHLAEETEEADAPSFTKAKKNEADIFGDEEMNNLFVSLFDRDAEEDTPDTLPWS